jgi:hypothetical protein
MSSYNAIEEKSINFHTTPTITLEALMDGEITAGTK